MGTLITIDRCPPEYSRFPRPFPKVEIITSLVMHRHFYRKISASSLSKLLRQAFTCLKWFRHEMWHDVVPRQQSRFEKQYMRLISQDLPSTLRNLCIFEDFNKLLHPKGSATHSNRSLGIALSKSSRFLENLSAAFLIDAQDFFAAFWPTKQQDSATIPWSNLRTLALTSHLLYPRVARVMINKLLIAAGRAAAFMPNLEVMEIWNGGEGHACVFQYSYNSGKPRITWSSSWGANMELDDDVLCCWSALPKHKQPWSDGLVATVAQLPKGRKQIKTHATIIPYLETRKGVLSTFSDYQLFWEQYYGLKRLDI
ncbi:hypothetical protein GGS23DRAFT_561312 [Durotheca rogersii]|uniref:uncharacterized protein n=1 Tax=Durotheca rogersii TaxID=419775 RepID=UPI00221F23F8|nr:uncharacterized protein GGS23DRAFT_561312 [Durotheca rogersii]KAI5864672.1 hypothetical protein GGS23DRAFT_561312 [Durotheca rogersii]